MASGLILNPQTLLTTLPLASSTGTIVLATSELNFFSTFVHPELRKKSGSILPRYWEYLFPRALPLVLACNLTTIVSSACNIYFRSERRLLPVSKTTLYWLGLAGAIGHLCFVPSVAPPIKRMIEAKDEAVSEMKESHGNPLASLRRDIAALSSNCIKSISVDVIEKLQILRDVYFRMTG
ncbi:hypothetical protein BDV25DRAFT_143062 [Aspergillus avenaceus]|uniref:Uncharacterized protein n=1 Tax=Aspergillus avenaceus TaxID=36643 RepID=A0A5N6TL79_ASPAV|nr:hypothetical protein BDV25DRAFT_143062 [Aspergillus avenaceus]